jgi:transcriptional regulator GlxA family with amidase domain
MKQVYILILEDGVLASIVDPHTIFAGVNGFLQSAGKPPIFNIQFVGQTRSVNFMNTRFSVNADLTIAEAKQADLILVPAVSGDFLETVKKNEAFIPFIIDQYKKGAEVASLCCGAFMLAATGLLNGKEMSSHWASAELFRQTFPEVTLVDGRIVTEHQGLYSSGGATSYWNLLLHLVEKHAGREMAILAAKIYALEIDRKSQSPFTIFTGQKRHEDEPIKRAQEFIEQNIAEKITIEDLSEKFAIGRRHFERRFKKATNNSPIEYIQRVRIEAAKKKLESSPLNVSQVMYEVGYSDPKAFRSTFKKITGISPADYRVKYNKEAAVGAL